MADTGPGRVVGIGGVFLKSPNQKRLLAWYESHLGFQPGTDGMAFRWRSLDPPPEGAGAARERLTAWSVFPDTSTYFDPSKAGFMINYIVDDLDAILARLAGEGVQIDPKREDHDYGRFGWIYDPDGNKIELWQPK